MGREWDKKNPEKKRELRRLAYARNHDHVLSLQRGYGKRYWQRHAARLNEACRANYAARKLLDPLCHARKKAAWRARKDQLKIDRLCRKMGLVDPTPAQMQDVRECLEAQERLGF